MKKEHGRKSRGHDTASMRFSMASTVAVADINFEDGRADAQAQQQQGSSLNRIVSNETPGFKPV
jgi:hypothetical protein